MTTAQAGSSEAFAWFLGIDWGTATHVLDLSDAAGAPVGVRTVAHTSAGLAEMVAWLTTVTAGPLARVAVAIEVPRGAVVELLLARGAAVFSLNPKQLDRFRDRFSVAGAKDDRLDAHVLGSALRTDRERFRRLQVDETLVIRLRELTRAREVLQQEFGALTNRVRELVHRIAPEWLTLSTNADDGWFWTVLETVISAPQGRGLTPRQIERVLHRHRIRRVTAAEVLEVLRAPELTVAPGTREAVAAHLQFLLPRVRLVDEQQRACDRQLTDVLEELALADATTAADHPDTPDAPHGPGDVAVLQSAPGVGTGVAAVFLADARALLRTRDYAALRAVTGVAPVRRQTGKNARGMVAMRYACNHRLRNACYHWARVSTRVDAAARAYYAALRARGHSHGRALRSVADRWLRILMAMLTTGTLYDATRFTPAGAVPPAPTA